MTLPIQQSLFSETSETNENPSIALLKQHFPQCFDKQGNFLPEKMAEQMSSVGVNVSREAYSLNWLGKSYARYLRDCPPTTLLSEDKAHNRLPQNVESQNLLIKGDNLEVLKHLKNAYANKIKMIYIDPPYNTGSDGFVYQDDRKFSPEQLAELAHMSVEEAKRVLDFTAKKSNSHSAWLTFMYPRLYIARELLKEDGVIFISIDDNEQAQLKLLCDDVLGEENFEGHIHWRRRHNQPNDKTKMIGLVAEHIFCYAKNSEKYKQSGVGKLPLTGTFTNSDNDSRGEWATKPWKVGAEQSGTRYEIVSPTGIIFNEEWMGERSTFEELLKDNRIVFTRNGNGLPRKKYFKFEREEEGQCATNWWTHEIFGHNQLGSGELADLFEGKKIFSNPKNTLLLKSILAVANCKNDDLVIDFFAGSGSFAHSVMLFNQENVSDNLKFICVQLPENLDENIKSATTENRKTIKNAIEWLDVNNKPHSLFEITKARIEKSAVKIQQDFPDYQGDLGFKIFETVADFRALHNNEDLSSQERLPDTLNANLTDEQYHTLLTTWRVFDGNLLTDEVQAVRFGEFSANLCGKTLYILQTGFDSEAIKALIEKLDQDSQFLPERIVLFGANVESAKQKELYQALSSYTNRKKLDIPLLVRY